MEADLEAVRGQEAERVQEVDPVQVLAQAPEQDPAAALVQAVRELAEATAVRELVVVVRDMVAEDQDPGAAVPESVVPQELATVRDLGLVVGSPEGGLRRRP